MAAVPPLNVRPISILWEDVMVDELSALHQTHTWDLVPLPAGKCVIGSSWVYKVKTKSHGSILKYIRLGLLLKATLKSMAWIYEETFAHVAKIEKLSQECILEGHHDFALFVKRSSVGRVMLSLYFDDMIITGDDCDGIKLLKAELSHWFAMKDLNNKIVNIPLDAKAKYTPTNGDPLRDPSLYHIIVRSLVYLKVTRLVHIVSQFVVAPTIVHWVVVLHIIRYLRGTQFQTSFLFLSTSSLDLCAYYDFDWPRQIEGKGSGGSKQTPAKNPDMPITKGELGNEIKRIMSEHLPTILAQSQENFRKAEEARKATEEVKKKKKANEEAERRRKAMEDKRAAEEQERKRTVEQDRKNAEDAQRLRNEEAERRRNAEAQRDECSYKAFLNCNPAEFPGDRDPVIVTNWVKDIEDIFEISECSTRQRVKYASHLLKGEARHWWDMIKIACGDDVASVMTWEEFKDLVMENYSPQGLMDKLEEEFLKLQQNDMTVPKYTTKGPVQQARPSTFQEAVELALMVEKENNRQLKEGGDNKRNRENRDDDMKKIKIINHLRYAKRHTGENVGMRIVIIMGNRDMQPRTVKLIRFVLGVRNLDIRVLIVLKGKLKTHKRKRDIVATE
ncbi:zinc finger, CCHC-type, retrotransposon gag domain protein [Tanacetum coccineum]|uniref:Zinc finger, CCHC-type, retrotransposon gag domain protein n=1 Tax=Tanacetum coccineum TaxID=301880 RepID=A0ABQ5E3P7_9ASTR